AWIYLPDIQESVHELRRAVKELGLKAVKFNGGWGNGDLANEILCPLYEEIADLNIPILLHPAARVFELQHSHPWLIGSERYRGFQHFPTALGFPLTYMVSAARLIFSGVLDRFPTLKFAFFEGGIGWVPWFDADAQRAYARRSQHIDSGDAVLRRQGEAQKGAE